MNRSSITGLFLAVLFTLILLVPACGEGTGNVPGNTGLDFNPSSADVSLFPQYLQEAVPGYQELSKVLKDTGRAYADLEAFKWQGMENLGYWEVQAAGAACQGYDRIYSKDEQTGAFSAEAKWIALSTMIPSAERVKTIGLALSRCNDTAVKINPSNYYSRVLGSAQADYEKDRKEWLTLCSGLDSSLKSALYLATTMEKTSNFATVDESFKQASSSTRDRYLGKFQNQSRQFSTLLAALISKLKETEADAARLSGMEEKK